MQSVQDSASPRDPIPIPTIRVFDPKKEFDAIKAFSMLTVAKRRAGKSLLIKDLFRHIKNNYSECYVFSLTAHLQPDLFDYIPQGNIIKGLDTVKLDEIWNRQQEYVLQELKRGIKKEKMNHILLIFDDVIADGNIRTSQTFSNLFIMGRHINFAVCVLSQYLGGKYGINAVCRKNLDFLFTFMPTNEHDETMLCDEYLSCRAVKEGKVILQSVTQTPFTVMCIVNTRLQKDYSQYCYSYLAELKVPKFTIGRDSHISMPRNIFENGKMYTQPTLKYKKSVTTKSVEM